MSALSILTLTQQSPPQTLCLDNHICNVLGIAEFGSICNPNRSCSIVRDKGLEAAYTLVHELGKLGGASPTSHSIPALEIQVPWYSISTPSRYPISTLNPHTHPIPVVQQHPESRVLCIGK